ncbi:MAG: CHASE4 domain-containing protein [Candidatus Parcubacteria bacterium]|nr:CHASE4 domain-containing protein [Candidatus Parcubacteria bacterium]
MIIRLKVILIVICSALALILTMFIVTQTVLLKSYINIENAEAVNNLERVEHFFGEVISGLELSVNDWSVGDSSYLFIEGKNPSFKDTELTTLGMTNIKVNAMAFINSEKKVVFSKMIDLKTENDLSSLDFVTYLTSHEVLIDQVLEKGAVSGIIDLPNGPMVVALHSIVHSDGSGPSAGVLVFGKFLNEDAIQMLKDETHLSINFYPYRSTALSDDILMVIEHMSMEKDKSHIQLLSDEIVAIHKFINDIEGNPILLLRVDTPRPAYNQGKSSLYLFMAMAGIAIILFGIVILFFVERFLVLRLFRLQEKVTKIAETRNFATQLQDDSHDELGKLTAAVNYMLVNLAESNKALEEMAKQLKKEVVQKTQEFEKSVEGYQSETQILQKNIDALERINLAAIERELRMNGSQKENETPKKQA